MNQKLHNDLDQVWALSNSVSSQLISEELRALVRRIQDKESGRTKTEDEIRQDPYFQNIVESMRRAGITDESAAFATYRNFKEKWDAEARG